MKPFLSLLLFSLPALGVEVPAELASGVATINRYYQAVDQKMPGRNPITARTASRAALAASPAPALSSGLNDNERDPFAVSPRLMTQGRSRVSDQFAPAPVSEGMDRIKVKAILWQAQGRSIVSLLLDNKDTVTLRVGETLTLGSKALRVKAIERDSVALEAGNLPQGLVVLR